ncbi:MAG: aryl-sulfate sulfotransferase [Candidatus Acidiferrum sp.]
MSKNHLWGMRSSSICLLSLLILAAGCGGGYQTPPPPPGTPAVTVAPNPVTFPAVSEGSTSSPTTITVTNTGAGALNISSVAFAGSNPGDFANTNNCSGSVASMGTCTISVTFVPVASGPLSETVTITDNAPNSPQVVNVSGTANGIVISLTPLVSAIGVNQTLPLTATGDPNGVTFSLAGFTDSSMGIPAPAGSIDASGIYTPPPGSPSIYVIVTAASKTQPADTSKAGINVVAPGTFTSTNNVQVAQYSVSPAAGAKVSVQFGLDTSYGFTTWTLPTGLTGGPTTTPLYVAGMKQSTPYHMRGVIAFADGSSFNDADFTFTTGALPTGQLPTITATTTTGMTPQSGIESLDLANIGGTNVTLSTVFTDLNGNVLWAYNSGIAGDLADPIKLLPNGHFLINYSEAAGDGTNSVLQEVDLGNNVIWQMTAAQLNTALAAAPASCTECDVTVVGTHHDFAILPNGHIVVIAATMKTLGDGTTPTGDVIIDLGDIGNVGGNNPNHTPQPVWAWNEFNHLDTNRRPYSYPDWMHTNAILYSKDDGNLIISIRHQNWLVKLPYENGAGSGDAIWKMGAVLPGDSGVDVANFTLLNADGTPDTNATDWFFAQHGPNFTSTNTAGQFSLVVFDNGDDRGVLDIIGGTCGVSGQPACFSTVPLLNIDETAKTVTFALHPNAASYSFFGGNAGALANGDVEYDDCGISTPANNSAIYEITQTATPQIVWQMQIGGLYAYRGFRMPSMYPGVQW